MRCVETSRKRRETGLLLATGFVFGTAAFADPVVLQEQKAIEGKVETSVAGSTVEQSSAAGAANDAAMSGQTSESVLRARIERLHKKVLTAEDYRSLNYGILGLISVKSIFSARNTVIEVMPDLPAATAGIRPGDVEIQIGDHVCGRDDNQRTQWNVADGEAGTPVDGHGQTWKQIAYIPLDQNEY